MKKILLLSDTHGYIDNQILKFIDSSDEVWHAGDIGSQEIISTLEQIKPLKIVYGNIDNHQIAKYCKKDLRFYCEKVDVLMTHIGGYPKRYAPRIKSAFEVHSPNIFVCGHTHILRVIYDKKYDLLYLNPGACGKVGFHNVRTLLRFQIDGKNINGMEVIELGKR